MNNKIKILNPNEQVQKLGSADLKVLFENYRQQNPAKAALKEAEFARKIAEAEAREGKKSK